jgi:peptidoglycan LD-endopeptidase LytH
VIGAGLLLLAACQVERVDPQRPPLPHDTTFAHGAYDPRVDREGDPLPNPHEANPPGVEDEGPVAPEDLPDTPLLIPVAGVQAADLVDTFEEARSQGRVHNAIDILAPRGRPVLAAVPGRVLRLFESERGGLTIYQRGPDGRTVYYYAHLDGYRQGLAEGQRVARGDTLGYVGETGNAPPGVPHLHFAMWVPETPEWFWEGEAINPYPLLREGRPAPSAR